jgi:hypothetical protein
MNFLPWLNLLTTMAQVVAEKNGAAPRELAYLSLLTQASTITSLTDGDLAELQAKYEAEVAADTPVTSADLDEIAARLKARSERIQGG